MDEIGQKLRAARIEKGYTLDDLQQITKIQKRYLIAIEEGNFDALPGDFYVRAFIKQYADTVGLDSGELLNQYQQDIPDAQPQEYVEQSVENKTRATRDPVNSPLNKIREHLPAIIIAVVAIIIVSGALYFMVKLAQNNQKQSIGADSSSVTVVSEKDDSASSSKSSKAASRSRKEAAKKSSEEEAAKGPALTTVVGAENGPNQPVTVNNLPASGNKLTIGATGGDAWVALIINGATTWQATVNAGQSQSVDLPPGTTSFTVKSGNATATTIAINGTPVDISTGMRIVRNIVFTVANTTEAAAPTTAEGTGDDK